MGLGPRGCECPKGPSNVPRPVSRMSPPSGWGSQLLPNSWTGVQQVRSQMCQGGLPCCLPSHAGQGPAGRQTAPPWASSPPAGKQPSLLFLRMYQAHASDARALIRSPSLLEIRVAATNPNSSRCLRKSRGKPQLPHPSLGKTVLTVWAVGWGAWDCHIGRSFIPSFGLSRLHKRHAAGGWRGGRTA